MRRHVLEVNPIELKIKELNEQHPYLKELIPLTNVNVYDKMNSRIVIKLFNKEVINELKIIRYNERNKI